MSSCLTLEKTGFGPACRRAPTAAPFLRVRAPTGSWRLYPFPGRACSAGRPVSPRCVRMLGPEEGPHARALLRSLWAPDVPLMTS